MGAWEGLSCTLYHLAILNVFIFKFGTVILCAIYCNVFGGRLGSNWLFCKLGKILFLLYGLTDNWARNGKENMVGRTLVKERL